jgi:anti-sigma factor RsiW
MNRREDVDRTIRQYLLGELSEPERAAIESEYFADGQRFEEVCALEDDLIDDYVRGNLASGERERFEQQYLTSTERLRRVQFAGSMLSSLRGISPKQEAKAGRPEAAPSTPGRTLAAMLGQWKPTPAPVLATLALVLAVAAALLGIECLRLRSALTASQQALASQSQKKQELEQQLADQRGNSARLERDLEALRIQQEQEPKNTPGDKLPPIVAAFSLRLGLIRGNGEPQVLGIAPDADLVELRLDLGNVDFKRYSAILQTPEGTQLWKQAEVRVRPSHTGKSTAIRVPAKLMPPGDYVLRLDGVSPSGESVEVSDSYFRVARKAAH